MVCSSADICCHDVTNTSRLFWVQFFCWMKSIIKPFPAGDCTIGRSLFVDGLSSAVGNNKIARMKTHNTMMVPAPISIFICLKFPVNGSTGEGGGFSSTFACGVSGIAADSVFFVCRTISVIIFSVVLSSSSEKVSSGARYSCALTSISLAHMP